VSEERWIVVEHWERYQHYKDRRPSWIKLYASLLVDQNYLSLSARRRALLVGLWLLYAQNQSTLRLRVEQINSTLRLRATYADYEALNEAGFITIRASTPLDLARGEESEEIEQERLLTPSSSWSRGREEHDDDAEIFDYEEHR